MKSLDLTLPTPAENLACDEALLESCEEGSGEEVLRFWESPDYFVVVGYGNRVAAEVHLEACASRHIPILRRCTGGGTVLQGPGCLNYSLILKTHNQDQLRSISAANRFIMERHRAALEPLLRRPVTARGHTDLALDEMKFSGNAQRRKRRSLLFHGSFLLEFNLRLISDLLAMPTRQPDYRRNRGHLEFLTGLNVPPHALKQSLRDAWSANEPASVIPHPAIQKLARDKYVTNGWNFKF